MAGWCQNAFNKKSAGAITSGVRKSNAREPLGKLATDPSEQLDFLYGP